MRTSRTGPDPDRSADKLAQRASALPVGDPREQTTAIGPLINADAVARVSSLVEDAVSKGATALSGGATSATRPSTTSR